MNFGLEDKVSVITGGARGIGLADAFALGSEGSTIILIDIDESAAKEAVNQLKAKNISAYYYQADTADESQVLKVAKQIEEVYGHCDVLVNLSLIHI